MDYFGEMGIRDALISSILGEATLNPDADFQNWVSNDPVASPHQVPIKLAFPGTDIQTMYSPVTERDTNCPREAAMTICSRQTNHPAWLVSSWTPERQGCLQEALRSRHEAGTTL